MHPNTPKPIGTIVDETVKSVFKHAYDSAYEKGLYMCKVPKDNGVFTLWVILYDGWYAVTTSADRQEGSDLEALLKAIKFPED